MSYPYTLKTGSLKEFIGKIPTIGVPEKINTKTLPSMGYKTKNDRSIPSILQFIDFIDSNGIPNDNYKAFRNKAESGIIMAKCLKKAYVELFTLYPDANKRSVTELRDFFAPKTAAGDKVLSQIVNTFKTLSEFADFDSLEKVPEKREKITEVVSMAPQVTLDKIQQGLIPSKEKRELAVNINIQFTLPEKGEPEIYERIFAALKKYFFNDKA